MAGGAAGKYPEEVEAARGLTPRGEPKWAAFRVCSPVLARSFFGLPAPKPGAEPVTPSREARWLVAPGTKKMLSLETFLRAEAELPGVTVPISHHLADLIDDLSRSIGPQPIKLRG